MDLFSLVAKLTLDSKEYDKEIRRLQSRQIDMGDVTVGLDTSGVDAAAEYIETYEINPPANPSVGLDHDAFDETAEAIPGTDIADPESPDVGLDSEDFDATAEALPGTEIGDPESPDVGLDTTDFDETVTTVEGTDIRSPASPSVDLDTTPFDGTVAVVEGTLVDSPASPTLGLDTTEYNTGLENAGTSADEFAEHTNSAFETVKNALIATGVVAAVNKVISTFKSAVNNTAQMGDEIDKGSKRMGISTKRYQEWDHALGQSGGGVNDLNRGLSQMQDIIQSVNNVTMEEISSLGKLGISIYDEQKRRRKSRSELAEEARERLAVAGATEENAEALETLNSLLESGTKLTEDQVNAYSALGIDPTSYTDANKLMEDVLFKLAEYKDLGKDIDERDNIVNKLFGRNSGGIKPLLDEGTEGMQELLNEAEKFGLIMTDEQIENAVNYGDAMANLQAALDSATAKFVDLILPSLTDAVNFVREIVTFFSGGDQQFGSALERQLAGLDKEFGKQSAKITETANTAKTLVEKLAEISASEETDTEKKKAWLETSNKLKELMPELTGYIDDETMSIKGNKEQLIGLIDEWEKYEKQRAVSTLIEKKEQAFIEANAEALDKKYEYLAAKASREREARKMVDYYNQNAERLGLEKISEDEIQFDANGAISREVKNKIAELYELSSGKEAEMLITWLQMELSDSGYNVGIKYNEWKWMEEDFNEQEEKYKAWLAEVQKEYGITEDGGENADETLTALGETIAKVTEKTNLAKKAAEEFAKVWALVQLNDVGSTSGRTLFSHAAGQWDVPTDEYPALLHRDEMVLSASRARAYRQGGGDGVDYNRLEEAIIASIRKGMAGAQVNSYLDGRQITDVVNRELAGQLQGRRFG